MTYVLAALLYLVGSFVGGFALATIAWGLLKNEWPRVWRGSTMRSIEESFYDRLRNGEMEPHDAYTQYVERVGSFHLWLNNGVIERIYDAGKEGLPIRVKKDLKRINPDVDWDAWYTDDGELIVQSPPRWHVLQPPDADNRIH